MQGGETWGLTASPCFASVSPLPCIPPWHAD